MANEQWTPAQQRAIDLRNKNILVSAAAGSGKTAVLVERIKKLILEDNVPIDRMLIVTFTKAAASEMKEKIRRAIVKEIDANPENSALLRHQLTLLSKANISTFHSFALEVLRRFFHMSDIDPGFKICDEAQATILKEESMDQLLEESFDKMTPEFKEFLDWYSSERNYDKIREQIAGAYTSLQAMPYPWSWLDKAVAEINQSEDEFKQTSAWKFFMNHVSTQAEQMVQLCQHACEILADNGFDKLAVKLQDNDLAYYEQVKEAVEKEETEKAKALMDGFKSARLTPGKEEKADYEEIKAVVSGLRDNAKDAAKSIADMFITTDVKSQIDDINQTAGIAKEFQRLLLRFDEIFKAEKAKKHLIDFNDIEHYCLEILENDQASAYYREKFQCIFIDEYQDTNVLQEAIIGRVKRENNLFMVGDIKQSIYKFRLAEPEIFKKKYDEYALEMEKPDGISEKIDLNRNFRSTPVILDEINTVFQPIMEDYNDDAKLYPGRPEGDNKRPSIRIIDLQETRAEDELAELKNAEIEALEVSGIIRGLIGKEFYDHKAGVTRPIQASDIVILMRGIKNYAGVYTQVLKEQGVDSYVDENEGYFDTIEIDVFMNLLSIIDNRKQDIPLISVLRSEIFDFTSLELASIREKNKRCSFEEALAKYAEAGDEPLRSKCQSAIDSIEHYRELAKAMPLGRFVWALMLETDYYIRCGGMPGGRQRQANLRALVEKAECYESMRQGSLFSFVRYIDAIKARKVPMGQVKLLGEGDDLVRIMTIHKSKGLEFPVVILSGMGKRLNYTKSSVGVSIHKDIGLGFTLVNRKEHWYRYTLMQKLIKLKVREEEVAEEKRILYVAMTRAKDYLYMTGTVANKKAFDKSRESAFAGDSTYLDMCLAARDCSCFASANSSEEIPEPVRFYGNPMNWNIYSRRTAEDETAAKEALRRLEFEYPYEKEMSSKSKYSVSELFHGERESSVTHMKTPSFMAQEKKLSGADIGDIYHTIMEHIDFVNAKECSLDFVQDACHSLIEKEILTEEEVSSVKLPNVQNFFHTELGKRCVDMAAEGKLYKEKPFTMETSDAERGKILVQGIIDCYFEEEDGIVIVDYKSNRVDGAVPFEQEAERISDIYKGQLDLYSEALEGATGKPVKERYLFLLSVGKFVRL